MTAALSETRLMTAPSLSPVRRLQYKITMGEVVATAPTFVHLLLPLAQLLLDTHSAALLPRINSVGSNQETYTFKNLRFNLWCVTDRRSKCFWVASKQPTDGLLLFTRASLPTLDVRSRSTGTSVRRRLPPPTLSKLTRSLLIITSCLLRATRRTDRPPAKLVAVLHERALHHPRSRLDRSRTDRARQGRTSQAARGRGPSHRSRDRKGHDADTCLVALDLQALSKTLLLVMANKQDVKGCMTAGEISQSLAYVPHSLALWIW